jgi:predicted metal-dependent hydrolase
VTHHPTWEKTKKIKAQQPWNRGGVGSLRREAKVYFFYFGSHPCPSEKKKGQKVPPLHAEKAGKR